MLHAVELKDSVPFGVVRSVRALVEAGERGNCPKLSVAGLDLLQVLHARIESLIGDDVLKGGGQTLIDTVESDSLLGYWMPILEALAEPAEKSRNGSVRQHAISMLTDVVLDRHGRAIPAVRLCGILNGVFLPLAEKRITDLLRSRQNTDCDLEEILIELELCISLLFKPFLHHLKALVLMKQDFLGIWISMLGIMTQLLGDEEREEEADIDGEQVMTREKLFRTTKELGSEHLRNAVMVLIALNILQDNSSPSDAHEISSVTWAAIGSIGYCRPYIEEWKICAREPSSDDAVGQTPTSGD